jgi:succinoglycan biosynthesis transport protein ExoP
VFVSIVFFLTKDEPKVYKTNASVYTGIATGSSIVSLQESKMDLFGTRTDFDNLINIITSRKTMEEVGLTLFASHLSLVVPDGEVIQNQTYSELMKIVPVDVKALIVRGDRKKTLRNLKEYKEKDYQNFVYELINYSHRHYSSKSIRSNTKVFRVQTSDMIEIQYSSDDPGICKQTLDILIDIFIEEYSGIKANQSDAVVRYFQGQIDEANDRLNQAENELLQFNRSNNIVNYYEQTKHIASEKEQANLTYLDVQMNNAAAESAMKALESKMNSYEKTQLNSSEINNLRNQLARVNLEIATKSNTESLSEDNEKALIKELSILQNQSFQLQNSLNESISQKYNLENTTEGLPSESILTDWLDKMIEYETTKAKLKVGDQKQKEFFRIFENYAPLGATMKRLERKIDVAEREYLALLSSLNLAKLNQQNIELNSNLKIVAAPFYPIVSEPSTRKFLLILALLIGFIIPAFTIILLEFLDQNIRNTYRAENFIGLNVAAIFPVLGEHENVDFEFVKSRGLDIVSRRLILNTEASTEKQKPDINILFSTLEGEGKSMLIGSLIEKLKDFGYKILLVQPGNNKRIIDNSTATIYYKANKEFHRVSSLLDMDADWSDIVISGYDYVFIEIPAILSNTYPIKLFKTAHHSFLVTRANRPWSKADKYSLKDILEYTNDNKPQLILNGVAIIEMETVLGDLPKRRSFIRRFIKNALRLQFFSQKSMGTRNAQESGESLSQKISGKTLMALSTIILAVLVSTTYLFVLPKFKKHEAGQKDNAKLENILSNSGVENDDNQTTASDKKLVTKTESTEPEILVKYQVVAGIFRSKENARQCFNLYKQFRYEPIILDVQGGLYRVVVGSYNRNEEAEKIRKEIMDYVPHADVSIYITTESKE